MKQIKIYDEVDIRNAVCNALRKKDKLISTLQFRAIINHEIRKNNKELYKLFDKMKKRKIYYRRKQGKIIAEGKRKNKTIYLFTIPEPEILIKSSLFTQEKREKLMEIISRLDINEKRSKKNDKKFGH